MFISKLEIECDGDDEEKRCDGSTDSSWTLDTSVNSILPKVPLL
jgi:hypothetical protein